MHLFSCNDDVDLRNKTKIREFAKENNIPLTLIKSKTTPNGSEDIKDKNFNHIKK